jgi:hypothetical protein
MPLDVSVLVEVEIEEMPEVPEFVEVEFVEAVLVDVEVVLVVPVLQPDRFPLRKRTRIPMARVRAFIHISLKIIFFTLP